MITYYDKDDKEIESHPKNHLFRPFVETDKYAMLNEDRIDNPDYIAPVEGE